MEKKQLTQIVFACVQEVLDSLEQASQVLNMNTPLYTQGGVLDSIALVAVISSLQQEIHQKLGYEVLLSLEDMFASDVNPFVSISTLINFIELHFEENLSDA
jgi:hypothetical protein